MEIEKKQQCTIHFQMEIVLCVLKGESIDRISRQYALDSSVVEEWTEKAIAGMELGLKSCSSGRLVDITDH